MTTIKDLPRVRAARPAAIAEAAAARTRPSSPFGPHGRVLIIAADHPARGMIGAGAQTQAMADRGELLRRLVAALARPGVNGALATPDVLEDLLLLGALEGKFVVGSMNRGGLAGASFEIDDRFTAYDAGSLVRDRFDGGKLLLRVDPADPASVRTLEAGAHAVSALAQQKLMAMVEPFMSSRVDGRVRNELTAEAVIRSIGIAAGLGTTSAYTWLKLPVVAAMERVVSATTLPCLLLGGEVSADQQAVFASWERALALPNVFGLVVGRSLLFPPDDDFDAAVDGAVALLQSAGSAAVA
ncbi:MAG: aldolase [Solirubrobacteraceae bacterium]